MNAPLHIQILQGLYTKVEARRENLRAKVGDGMEDRTYQQHVGRIKEASVLLEEIDAYLKHGLDDLEAGDEEIGH